MPTAAAASERWFVFLARASAELATSLDYETTFNRIVELSVPELADVCALELLDRDGVPHGVALTHVDPATVPLLREVLGRTYASAQPGPRRLALTSGRAQLVSVGPGYWHMVAADEVHERQLDKLGMTSIVSVPLRGHEGNLGVMTLAFIESSGRRFTENDLPVIEDLAHRAALAVENAQLFQSEREARAVSDAARARLTVLAEASRVLSGSLDFERTMRNVARVMVPAVADHVVVDLLEPNGLLRRVVSVGRDEQRDVAEALLAYAPDVADGDHFVNRVLQSGESMFVPAIAVGPHPSGINESDHLDLITRLGVTSTVMAPLAGHDEIVGVLTASTTIVSDRRFSPDDAQLIEDLAQRAAVAVQHARLFAMQRDAALTLQRSLLPSTLPTIPGVASAWRYVPAAPHIEVGGDWYDVIAMPGGHVLAAMGDVEGRGVPAAARMGQLRNAMLAYAAEGRTPAQILTGLDRLLSEHGPRGLATLVLAMIEPESGAVRLANAGHPPPMWTHPNGAVTFVEQGLAAPLGALARTHYYEFEFGVQPGDTLVFFTDGVFEDRTESADVGLERLRRAIYDDSDADIERMVDNVLEAGHGGVASVDDAAVLAVRLQRLGPCLSFHLPADAHVLTPLRGTLRRWLRESNVDADLIADVVLASGEACANAIEHAYGPRPAHFDVNGDITADEIEVVVRDTGTWRRPRADESRGRGHLVMEAFAGTCAVDTSEQGTKVTLRWSRPSVT